MPKQKRIQCCRRVIVPIVLVLFMLLPSPLMAITPAHPQPQSDAINQCGQSLLLLFQGQFTEAQPMLEAAVATLSASPTADPQIVGMCATYLAIIQHSTGDWTEALATYETALTAFIDSNDQQMQWAILFGTSSVYTAQGRFADAYKLLQQALPLTGAVQTGSDEVRCLLPKQDDESITIDADQPWVVESLKPLARAVTLNNMGLVVAVPYSQEQSIGGTVENASACFETSLHLIRALHSPTANTARLTEELAEILGPITGMDAFSLQMMLMLLEPSLTDEDRALLAQMLPVLQMLLPKPGESANTQPVEQMILGMLAMIVPELGKTLEPIVLSNLGQVLRGTDDAQAQLHLETALQQIEENQRQNMTEEFRALLELLGPLLSSFGVGSATDLATLTKTITEMLDWMMVLQTTINLNARAIVLNNLALVYRDQGDGDRAERTFQEVLDIYQNKLANNFNAVNALVNLGYLAQQAGETNDALAYYEEAIKLLESVRIVAEGDATQLRNGAPQVIQFTSIKGVLDQQADVYALAASLYMQQGEGEEALRVIEQGRSRLFLDMINSRTIDLPPAEGAILLAIREAFDQRTQAQASLAQLITAGAPRATIRQWEDQWQTADESYQTLRTTVERDHPHLLDFIPGGNRQIDLTALQSSLRDEAVTVLVYYLADGYFADETENLVMAWVIDSTTIQAIPLSTTGPTARAQIATLRESIKDKDFYAAAAGTLYNTLFAPLAPYIQQTNLVIVPYGSLYYLPFAALWNSETERYLIEDYTITYAPSLATLPLIQAQRNPNQEKALIMGIPDGTPALPAVTGEVQAIAELYNTEPVLSQAATESYLRQQATDVDLLHVAAHGNFDSVAPLQSAIELTGDVEHDGILAAREVFSLDLAEANLVFLSACQTALGEQSLGDEITGLTRAFLYAGVPSIITTLWSIEDQASSALVSAFYQQLQEKSSFAAALQSAQLTILRQDQWRDPYYWAAFTLHGDYLGVGERQANPTTGLLPVTTPAAINTPSAAATPTPPPVAQLEVLVNTLNVRSGPGTAYPVIGQLKAGNQVAITGQDAGNGWLEICCVDGQSGWVINNQNYIRLFTTNSGANNP